MNASGAPLEPGTKTSLPGSIKPDNSATVTERAIEGSRY
jgi:hypothetical protein